MNRMNLTTRLLMACLALVTYSTAEESEGRSSASTKIYLIAITPGETLESPLQVSLGERNFEHAIAKRSLGLPIQLEAGIHPRVVVTTSKDGQQKQREVDLTPSTDWELSIIVIHPSLKKEDRKLTYSQINLQGVDGGAIVFLNLWKNPVKATIGQSELTLAPGGNGFQKKKNEEPFTLPFAMSHQEEANAQWTSLVSSKTTIDPSRNELAILFKNGESGDFDYRGIVFQLQD